MKQVTITLFIFSFSFLAFKKVMAAESNDGGWKAGVARVVINPGESIWMAGYESRDQTSEGTMHDLWAKALALEDEGGERCILITIDLCAIPKDLSDRIGIN